MEENILCNPIYSLQTASGFVTSVLFIVCLISFFFDFLVVDFLVHFLKILLFWKNIWGWGDISDGFVVQ